MRTGFSRRPSIGSVVSDCKSHHLMHYGGSHVGAYFMPSVHLGNIVTDNSGLESNGITQQQLGNFRVLLPN